MLEALEAARLGFNATDPHIASCQNNLAELYRNTKQYDKAEVLYKEVRSGAQQACVCGRADAQQ